MQPDAVQGQNKRFECRLILLGALSLFPVHNKGVWQWSNVDIEFRILQFFLYFASFGLECEIVWSGNHAFHGEKAPAGRG